MIILICYSLRSVPPEVTSKHSNVKSSGVVKRQSSPHLLLKVKGGKSIACTIFYMLPLSQKEAAAATKIPLAASTIFYMLPPKHKKSSRDKVETSKKNLPMNIAYNSLPTS
jgi:hypothetical protein